MSASILSMDHETENRESDCCGLGNLFYNVAKHMGRNDFLYLAHANSLWFLEEKIKSKEFFENRDKYYLRIGRVVNEIEISLYHTPLQEAIKEGNLKVVQLLCSVGADMHKKIKNAQELQSGEAATEPYGSVFINSWPKEEEANTEIENFKNEYYIGCSALKLAERMLKESEDKHDEREEIAEFLSKNNKND